MTTTTEQPENPPVFPRTITNGSRSLSEGGMELRDYIAAAVLQGVGTWSPDFVPLHTPKAIEARARFAYEQADAMLRERGE